MSIPPPVSPYVITVKYTPLVTGCHTICFRMTSFIANPPGPPDPGPDPEFCCQQDVVINIGDVGVEQTVLLDAGGGLDPCPNPGTPITVVSALGSGTYFYNGYVQPCCAVGAALQQAWPNAAVFIVAAP